MSGKVVHFEIPYDDGERAGNFYAAALGWQLAPVPDMDYTMVLTGPTDPERGPTEAGFINGGMFARGDQFPGASPTVVVDVPSVEAALGRVEAAGGKTLVPRTAVGDMGFVGYFADTEDNVVGLWETA